MYIDLNIDALLARYSAPIRPAAKVAVIGEIMRRELKEVHGVPDERIAVVGAVRYDHYFSASFKHRQREEFFKEWGLDPGKRLLIYATLHPLLYPQNADIIRIILDAIKNNECKKPSQLLVTFFPTDTTPYEKLFHGERNLILKPIEENIPRDDVANLLHFCDVLMGIGTTMSLEAAAVGAPSIWIGFDGFTHYQSPKESIRASYEIDHLRYCIEDGGVPVAESKEDLIRLINRYLENRDADKDKREALLKKLYYKPDGHAAERIADVAVEISKK